MTRGIEMAVTLKHQTQKALSLYSYMDTDHPLQLAWSDYQFAKSNALPCHDEKARLKRELALEAHITRVLESIHVWATNGSPVGAHIHGYGSATLTAGLPPRNDKRGAA